MELEPLPPDEGGEPSPQPLPLESGTENRRLIIALMVYAALAIAAAVRLEGRPRLVVWMFLGLFAIKTLLVVLKRRAD